jgi:hypothetical protein
MNDDSTPSPKPDPGVLRLRKRDTAPPPSPMQEKTRPPTASGSKPKKKKRKHKQKPGTTVVQALAKTLGSCVIALLLCGLFLAHQVLEWELLPQDTLLLARNITLAAFLVVLILEAFSEDLLQGILCLFLLPYTVFYGVFMSDAGPIRGITIAILMFLGAEIYFTPEQAVVPKVEAQVSSWIRSGQDALIYPDGRPQAGFE